MPDVQILASGTQAAPLDYDVPATSEIILKAAGATFDGTGAAAAFLPAIVITPSSGVPLPPFVTDTAVAAGGSAEVAFAPFLRNQGAASGSGVGVELNDALVATEPNIDFVDGGVTWTITDDAANSRVKIVGAGSGSSSTDFGPASYEVPLWNYAGAANTLNSIDVGWTYNAAPSSGGYVTKAAPAVNSFFAVLVSLHPQSSIWGFTFTYLGGSDFGIVSIDIASITYQSVARGSGSVAGKIQDIFRSGTSVVANYGANPVFQNLTDLDCYSAAPTAEANFSGTLTFIPGGAEGTVLTNLAVSNDPWTGYAISDGGPGWYALRFQVRAKNAASSNYRFQIPRLSVLRRPDDEGF